KRAGKKIKKIPRARGDASTQVNRESAGDTHDARNTLWLIDGNGPRQRRSRIVSHHYCLVVAQGLDDARDVSCKRANILPATCRGFIRHTKAAQVYCGDAESLAGQWGNDVSEFEPAAEGTVN